MDKRTIWHRERPPDFGRGQVSISLEGGVNTPLLAADGVPIPYKKV